MSYDHFSNEDLLSELNIKQRECIKTFLECAEKLDSRQEYHDRMTYASKVFSTVGNISSVAVYFTGGASAIPGLLGRCGMACMAVSTVVYTGLERKTVNAAQKVYDETVVLSEALYKRAWKHWSNKKPLNIVHGTLGKIKSLTSVLILLKVGLLVQNATKTEKHGRNVGSRVLARGNWEKLPQDMSKDIDAGFARQTQVLEKTAVFIGVALIPFDIADLIKSAKDLEKGSFSDVAQTLREKASEMEETLKEMNDARESDWIFHHRPSVLESPQK